MAAQNFPIPESASTVDISIIDTTSRIRGIQTELFMEPKIKGHDIIDCPAYSFLIENEKSGQKILFDLGVRKDWENLAPKISNSIREKGWSVTVEKGVADILKDGPGFKDAFVPGFPAKEDCPIRESDYAGRELRELSFDLDLTIGGYKALDYFGDGSFYLLDSPG
ncbi:MAG: hypothetical protein Q9215_008207, partial [Flavoplaca cf. flavocitrina]